MVPRRGKPTQLVPCGRETIRKVVHRLEGVPRQVELARLNIFTTDTDTVCLGLCHWIDVDGLGPCDRINIHAVVEIREMLGTLYEFDHDQVRHTRMSQCVSAKNADRRVWCFVISRPVFTVVKHTYPRLEEPGAPSFLSRSVLVPPDA